MRRNKVILMLLVLVFCYGVTMATGYKDGGEEELGGEIGREWEMGEGAGGKRSSEWFLLQNVKQVIKTDAGNMKVVRSVGGRIIERPMHIGFITMEPKGLFVPQYLDSSLIIFVRRGEARLGFVYSDELVERRLKTGDIYRIPAGSAFYLENTGIGQRLEIICSIDTSESLGLGTFQSFYIGGGTYPTSIIAGFDPQTLTAAFNVSLAEIKEILTRQTGGPIVFVNEHAPSIWTKFLQLRERDRLQHLKRMVESQQETRQEDEQSTWSWRKLLGSVFRQENSKKNDDYPDSYNLYNKSPDFKNNYGRSTALDGSDYSPLKHSGIGVYLVYLNAGSMMAPHVNPTAAEYGIVLRGSGWIKIVHPNGTSAMNAEVKQGSVFFVPKYFAFCQIASRTSPFEFFGFTTSAQKNRPLFLAGANSILHALNGPQLAASFGVSEKKVSHVAGAQREAVILPTPTAAPPHKINEEKMVKFERVPTEVIKNFGSDMIMGFD